jgi:glyoxylase-like metal-dependent hydrolase (beta-lactamase superfamily II)
MIKGSQYLLIDTGPPGSTSEFIKRLKRIHIAPSEIKWIFITHGHWDHAGSLEEIRSLTGARVMIHVSEKEWVEKGLIKIPSGLDPAGQVMHFLMRIFAPLTRMPGSKIHLALEDPVYPLDHLGIPGKIVHTPGHTNGSMSLILETGDAFVGDLAMNGFPQFRKNGIPVVGDDLQEVKKSWEILLNQGTKMVYPAHGTPFSIAVLEKNLRDTGFA